MMQIQVEANPSRETLDLLGVSNWGLWEKEVSEFNLDFGMTEHAYLLDGEVHITSDCGEVVVIKAGDLAVFPRGLKTYWRVTKPLRKLFLHSIGNPSNSIAI